MWNYGFESRFPQRPKPIPRLKLTNLDHRYLPGRALVFSVLGHFLATGCLVLVSILSPPGPPGIPVRVTMIDLRDPNYRLYLPVLLDEALPANSDRDKDVQQTPSPEPASASVSSSSAFRYPGPQPIVSDLPNPTNRIQTILQPQLTSPRVLPPPIALPNMVQMPKPEPREPLTAPQLAPPVPKQPFKGVDALANTTPVLPTSPVYSLIPRDLVQNIPDLPAPPAPNPETDTATLNGNSLQRPPTPAMPENTALADSKPGDPLLVVSPIPAPPSDVVKVPEGESRGRFVISPEPNTREEKDDDHARLSTASGATAPDGKDGPANTGVSPSSNSGTSSTLSSGAVGKPKSAFPGITILPSGAGPSTVSVRGNPVPLQTSYGMTIVSTESSGGGLPQFGVFANEQIYTVYLDMRRTPSEIAPSWTLEYAVLKRPDGSERPASDPSRTYQGLVPPFPVAKELPIWPPELIDKYPKRRLIVYAVINKEGKMEQLAIKESPDPLLDEPVLTALRKWSFRAAQSGGENVAVKALFGIPVASAR